MAKLGLTIKNVIRGDTRTINTHWRESDGTTAINIASCTIYFTLNTSSDPSSDSSAVVQKTYTSFTDASAGDHTVTLTHSDTNIAAGTYWYDTQLIDTAGAYLSSYRGKFIIQSDVTRS